MSPWEKVGRARRQQNGDGIKIEIDIGPLARTYWITRSGVRLLATDSGASFGVINPETGVYATAGKVRVSKSGKMLLFEPDWIGVGSMTRKRCDRDGAEWQIPARDLLAHYGRRDPEWVGAIAPSEVLVRWGVQAPLAPEAIAA
jgi:hypothetical protein